MYYYIFNSNNNTEDATAFPLQDKHSIRAIREENYNLKNTKTETKNINNIDNKINLFYENEDRIERIYWRGVDSIISLNNKYHDSLFNVEKRQSDSIFRIKEFNDSLKIINYQELKMKLQIGDIFENGIVFDIDKLNNKIFLVSRLLSKTNNRNGEVEGIKSSIGQDWYLPTPENIKKIIKISMNKGYAKFIKFDSKLPLIWDLDIWTNTGKKYNNLFNQLSSDGEAFCLFIKVI
jgi:hypothetical protein